MGSARRDFLKASTVALLGSLLVDRRLEQLLENPVSAQGRVTISGTELFKEPAFNAAKLRSFRRDELLTITGEALGDPGYGNPFNSTWYLVNGEGYTYSGWIQPVQTVYQNPVLELPGRSLLGEVTVPLSDTRREPSGLADRGYRLYYSSLHWVTDVVVNHKEKGIWYKIYDRLLQESLYVMAYEMRLIDQDELAPLNPEVPEEDKHIHIDLATQTVTASEGERVLLAARCSSGDKGSRTPLGEFRTFHKGPSIHMTNQGDAVSRIYDLPGVPWVTFFTGTGVALHGTYWHNDYGRPRSRGCVNLRPADAKFIYRWTRPVVPPDTEYLYRPGEGTNVVVSISPAS